MPNGIYANLFGSMTTIFRIVYPSYLVAAHYSCLFTSATLSIACSPALT